MDSITKTRLSNEQINTLIKTAFGEKVNLISATPVEDGWFSSIYILKLDNNLQTVLKIGPAPDVEVLQYEKDIMSTEVHVLKLLKETTNVPVPEVYFHDTSRTLLNNEYYFMEMLRGESYSKIKETLREEQRQAIEFQLGQYNYQINNIKRDTFGSIPFPEKMGKKWSQVFLGMVKDLLEDGKKRGVELPYEYSYIESLYTKRSNILDAVTEACLVDWDLHDGNLFVDETGNNITGIIDFERSFFGDPLIEVYFGKYFGSKHFIDGYGHNLMDSEEAKCRRILYDLYLSLVMVIECKYRNVQDENHIKWTFNEVKLDVERLQDL